MQTAQCFLRVLSEAPVIIKKWWCDKCGKVLRYCKCSNHNQGKDATMQHKWWICDCCGTDIPFRQPELPGDDPRSEMNEDRKCPRCGEQMYFDEVPEAGVLISPNATHDGRGTRSGDGIGGA